VWAQWALFAVLAIVSMVLFRSRIYRKLGGRVSLVHTGPPGGVITLQVDLAPGASCQAEHGGTFWTLRNDSDVALRSGSCVRVASVHGLTLLVRPEV
jgi:membrane protein implicated in regulation of membrane protease activity